MVLCAAAGALLYDARELFDAQNAALADEGLRAIVGQLPAAVATCVDAAQAELDPTRQAALIKARSVGSLALSCFSLLMTHEV